MSHDRIAELAGLRNELADALNGPRHEARKSAVSEVRGEIERVRGELKRDAKAAEQRAAELLKEGRDGLAEEARVLARNLLAAIGPDEKKPAGKPAGTSSRQSAVAAKPPEQRDGGS